MSMLFRSWRLALVCAGLLTASMDAGDWPRFRGPNGSGICEDDESFPTTWSPGDNVKWSTDLPGAGVSCPIVIGDAVFVTCYSGYGLDRRNPGDQDDLKRHLVRLDRDSGSIIWTTTIDAVLPEDPYAGAGVPEHGYASHTPVSDGERVYVFFGKTGALAFDFDGNEVWRTGLGTESDPRRWGSASSPILHNDLLIVTASAESEAIVALDTSSGDEVWRAEANGLSNLWGTPILVPVDDERTDLVVGVPYEFWALNPETGKLRWFCEVMPTDQYNSSVVFGDGVIYGIEGRGGGSVAVRAGGEDDVTGSHVVWSGRDSSRFVTPLLHEGLLYYFSGNTAACLEASSGDRVYQKRLTAGEEPTADDENQGRRRGRRSFRGMGGQNYASPILADGKIYYTTRAGHVHVIAAGREFEELAVNRVSDAAGEDFSATPAASEGQLFLRSNKAVYCVQEADTNR